MSDAVDIGLVGAGPWGRVILGALGRVPGARLTRLATRQVESLPALPPGCAVDPDPFAVAAADDVAAVIIATPASTHADLATAALKAGRPVLVEKPMTHTLARAADLVALAMDLDGILRVNHIDLHKPAWHDLKARLARLGPVEAVEMEFGGPGAARADVPSHWDWGAHAVALAYDLFGPPASVDAQFVADGLVHMNLGFSAGPSVAITTGNGFRDRHRRVAVHGRDGTLTYDDNAPAPVPGDALVLCLQRFVSSVRLGAPDWNDAVLGLSVVTTLTTVEQCLQ